MLIGTVCYGSWNPKKLFNTVYPPPHTHTHTHTPSTATLSKPRSTPTSARVHPPPLLFSPAPTSYFSLTHRLSPSPHSSRPIPPSAAPSLHTPPSSPLTHGSEEQWRMARGRGVLCGGAWGMHICNNGEGGKARRRKR
jgi:hypothetical protein